MSAEKPRRLGRGLEALIPGSTASTPAAVSDLQRIRSESRASEPLPAATSV